MSARKSYITAFILLVTGSASLTGPAVAESKASHEYCIKAAFMHQFVNFIDGWKFQQEDNQDDDRPILIGVIGDSPFEDAFEPLQHKKAKGRNVTIRYFKGFSQLDDRDDKTNPHSEIENIKQCDVLFICSSEEHYIDNILDPIRHERILTIADTPGFIERGGILNFIVEKNKVCFEINTAGAYRAKLKIRSKLLRLAKRIVTTDNVEDK
jgi:hypothetical protein